MWKKKVRNIYIFLKSCLLSYAFGTRDSGQAQKLSTSKDNESSSELLRIELFDSFQIHNFLKFSFECMHLKR